MGNKTHLAFLSRKTFRTGPRAQSQILKSKTDLLRIVIERWGVTGPESSDQIEESDSTMGDEVVPNFRAPSQKEQPTTVHRPDTSVRTSKLLGRLERGVLGWDSGWPQERIAYLTCQRSPSASCQPQEQGVQQEFTDWTLGFKNTTPLLQTESGMLHCHHLCPLAPGP